MPQKYAEEIGKARNESMEMCNQSAGMLERFRGRCTINLEVAETSVLRGQLNKQKEMLGKYGLKYDANTFSTVERQLDRINELAGKSYEKDSPELIELSLRKLAVKAFLTGKSVEEGFSAAGKFIDAAEAVRKNPEIFKLGVKSEFEVGERELRRGTGFFVSSKSQDALSVVPD